MKRYEVTIEFIGGLLAGLTHTSIRDYELKVGMVVSKPVGGSPYRVVSCVAL